METVREVLFDTHPFLWASDQPERLSTKVRSFLEGGGRPLVSVATLWEIVIRIQKGKLDIDVPSETISQAVRDLEAELLPVRLDHVLGILWLEPHHNDPLDRLLVAQAIVEGAALATKDSNIRRYPVVDIL